MDLPALSHPERLAWLGVLPLLWWLSRPPIPRRTVLTPHLALWQRAQARLRRRPRRSAWLRLLLLLLAFGAAVLAYAGPRASGTAGARSLAVLLDTSASMAADDALAAANAQLRTRLQGLPAATEVRLALCGRGITLHRGLGSEVVAALPSVAAGEGAVDLAALAAILAAEPGLAVWTLTDARGAALVPTVGALSVVGQPQSNLAITAASLDDPWPLPDLTVQLEVRAFGPDGARAQVIAEGPIEPVPAVELLVASNATERVTLTLRRKAGGTLRIGLVGQTGALVADDAVTFALPAPPPATIGVLADTEAGPWAHAAAAALARETGGVVVTGGAVTDAGFWLLDGGVLERSAPSPSSGRPRVSFGTRGSSAALRAEDLVPGPAWFEWDRSDDLLAGLDLSELSIVTCLRDDFLGSGKVLARAPHGPLMTWDQGEGHGALHVSFRLADSNLPLLPAFPQLLRRAYARAFGVPLRPPPPEGLLSADESDLARAQPWPDRPLPAFQAAGGSWVMGFVLAALTALIARIYV